MPESASSPPETLDLREEHDCARLSVTTFKFSSIQAALPNRLFEWILFHYDEL